jgi:integrase
MCVQRGHLKLWKNRSGVKVWRFQWRDHGHPKTKLLGEYSKVSRRDARAEADRILAPLNALARSASIPTLFRRYVEQEYLATRTWKQSTQGTTEQIIEQHILQAFGDRAIASVSRRELQTHLNAKAAANLSSSVVKHIKWQLKAIYRMAEGDGVVTVNPANGLVNPKCKPEGEKKTITVDELLRAQMVLELRDRLVFRLSVAEGLRPSEIMGLQPGDYYDGMFHIRRRVYRGVIDEPKSQRSRREIPATSITAALLSKWLELLPVFSSVWLFPSETGKTPISCSNLLGRRIKPALAAIGVHANFQILRRTWVTKFSEAEKDPTVRAQLVGHSVDVEENVYRQAQPHVLKRAMKKLERKLQ